ncbi:hypothetical protein F511_04262 [Dorcoceras hygrometricum]|uniref:Uncharacterized protein n=1 Tax=Dorcoceras hygrometricum TaxID=472368 RepID=A0A2Z7CYX9_9LAMI|nr:hypothetical protein F511_04262 [Dorcoceras hygrometricum]
MGIDQLALHSVQLGYLKILQMGEMRVRNHRSPSHPDLNNNSKFYLDDVTHDRRQQLRDLALAKHSLQEWYQSKELFVRSPTLPRTSKTTVGNDGNSPKKLTVNSTRSLALAQNNQTQATGNQTQATVELTIVDICSQLDNQSTHTRTNPRSWYQSQHPNDVAPTYRNAVDARASGDTALSSPCWDLLATMRRVVNYHSSWVRQRQVELFDVSGNPGFTAGHGFNPAGGAPGGG